MAALRRRQFQLVDVKRAPTERADALYLFRSRLSMGGGSCNGTPHFGRENKLALALRRIHAAIIRTGVVLVSEVPAVNLRRIRHKVKRRGQACQILRPASLVNGDKPTELGWLEHEEESLAELMLKTLSGSDSALESNLLTARLMTTRRQEQQDSQKQWGERSYSLVCCVTVHFKTSQPGSNRVR